jgi:DNA invertase Pin-like site-specific DNA recombinase
MSKTVAYVRVSTDQQDTARQHTSIKQWSERHNVVIDEFYLDHGRRHEADKRPDFQRLIKNVESGQVSRIIIDAQDRLGFQGPFEWYHYLWVLQSHNCKLISAVDDRVLSNEDAASFITTGIGAHSSREEMMKKSSRDLGKKVEMAKAGEWTGGWIPFGCDVTCRSPQGTERWRVVADGKWKRIRIFPDGRSERWDGKDAFPRDRQPGDTLVLDRTIKIERIEILSSIFSLFNQGWPYYKIGHHLNSLGHWHPHGPWYPALVRGVLQNPACIGYPAYNKRAHGLYSELGEDGRVRVDPPRHPDSPHRAKTGRKRASSAWILPTEPIFEPIVAPEAYRRAQELLASIKPGSRAPKSDRLWLSGLVFCGKCGRAMCGWSLAGLASYTCSTYRAQGASSPSKCRLHRVRVEVIENHLNTCLADLGQSLESLVGSGESGLLPALYRGLGQERDKLASLRAQMEQFLLEALQEIVEPVPLPDGRKRFEIVTPDGVIQLDLPGCTDPAGLEYLYAWVSSVKRNERAGRVRELEAELARLYRRWAELDGLGEVRELVRREMSVVDAELARLKANDLDLCSQVRDTYRHLCARSVELAKARRELASSSLRARSVAVRKVLDRIVLWFDYRQHGQQTRSILSSIDFVPLVGDLTSVQVGSTLRGGGRPERG